MEVRIEGIDELKKRLDPKRFEAASRVAIGKCAEEVKIQARPYPPEGPWNRPGEYPKRWYQRLYGPRWALKGGSIGGRNTSEKLQQHWYTKTLDAWRAMVWNTASYAPWVKGEDQAASHKQHGWKKLTDDAETVAKRGVFLRIYREQIDKALGGK